MRKNFLFRLLLFFLIPLPPLFFLNYAVDAGLSRSRYLYFGDWNDMYNGRINADVLVMGTSRAYVHVSPAILDTALHANSYNLGLDGASFDIQDDIFRLYLQHNKKPAYILQEVGYPTFVRSDSDQYLQEFIAHIADTAVWRILKQHAAVGTAERLVPLYKYKSQPAMLKEGLLSYIGRGQKELKYKGYEARDYPWDSTFFFFKRDNPQGKVMPIDSGVLAVFNAYLQYCNAQGIKVILFYPPTYYISRPYILNFPQIHQMIIDCAVANHVPLLDYNTDTMNNNKAYFYNTQHLNKKGAELFSTKLAADVKALLSAKADSAAKRTFK